MNILSIIPYLLCFLAGLVLGKYINFLDKKGKETKENKEIIIGANKPEDAEDISNLQENQEEQIEEDLRDYPPVAMWEKRKNIAKWDENFPLNVSWKYECKGCGYESLEKLPECPHCKAKML